MDSHIKAGLAATLLIAVLVSSPSVLAQRTIPQVLSEANASIGRTVQTEYGGIPSFESVAKTADLIVRGVVGEPLVRLSDDLMDVYSDYPIINPVILFPSSATNTDRPGVARSVVVTAIGGTITINGRSFYLEHKELPPLRPGIECLFLLRRKDDTYQISGTYFGVFRIDDDIVTPLTTVHDFANDLRGKTPAEAIRRLLEARMTSPK